MPDPTILRRVLLAAGTCLLLAGCAYDPYTGAYVPCCVYRPYGYYPPAPYGVAPPPPPGGGMGRVEPAEPPAYQPQ